MAEVLANRKLLVVGVLLLIILVVSFLLGGIVAPAPSSALNTLSVKCVDDAKVWNNSKWFLPRGSEKALCKQVNDLDDVIIERNKVEANQIIFSQMLPLPRDGNLDMSRWFQMMIAVLQLDIAYNPENPMGESPTIRFKLKLGARDKTDGEEDWKVLAEATEDRILECTIDEPVDGEYYKCQMLPLFELGSVHYDYYLINIRIPVIFSRNINTNLGRIKDLHIISIIQNGGFTKVWFSMKTVLFPILLGVLVWYWKRIQQLSRLPNLLERTLFALGIVLSIMNCPIEWFTLWFDMPYMLIVGDIRQGAFYAMLLCFWVIFAGEHMMDQMERNKLSAYWKHLTAIIFGCSCFLVFKICMRAFPLHNPFFSIWNTKGCRYSALTFIVLAVILVSVNFLFLCYKVFKAVRNNFAKMKFQPEMFDKGLIYRLLATLLCAALTVIFFIISQVSERGLRLGDDSLSLEYPSAFLTGVYGMWNVYTSSVYCVHAPPPTNLDQKLINPRARTCL